MQQNTNSCLKQKGDYSHQNHWPPGHCKRGNHPFEIIDFVEMPMSWWLQSLGNIGLQHCTIKMLCEDRGCKWTNILESVISSMNTTISSATSASSLYIIIVHPPNIGLPRITSGDTSSNSPTSYGMQIGSLLRQVHNRVALASNEADQKFDCQWGHISFQDTMQPGNKILLHWPHSVIAHNSHLPWISTFDVIKSNDLVLLIQNETGD